MLTSVETGTYLLLNIPPKPRFGLIHLRSLRRLFGDQDVPGLHDELRPGRPRRSVTNAFGLEPHRQRHFKLSNDPFFVEKVRDIVGLYVDPETHSILHAPISAAFCGSGCGGSPTRLRQTDI